MALSMARHAAQSNPVGATPEVLKTLLQRLTALPNPQASLNGKTIYIEISATQLFDLFQSQKFKS